MWRQILALCLLWAPVDLARADVVIRADGAVTPIRKTKPPVLLQAKATLKRPDHHTVQKPSKGEADEETQGLPLSFLQEEETARAASVTKTASADEFLTEVLPMAGPSLPMQTKVAAATTSPETFQVLSLILLVSVTLVAASFYRRPRDRVTQQVESLPILLGSDLTSQSQTGLVRLEGHVVLDGKDALTAPFSEKTCVFYSASVSHPRHDEIRQPPVAFNTKQTKFCLELQDAPEIRVQVAGDVSLFNMQTGQEEWQHAFTEAPKNWCSFVLNHLVVSTDAGTHFKKCLDLGSDGVFLDFREAALLLGSHVCCVGQVEKDAEGRWSLRPWQPPAGQSKRWSAASAMWRRKDCLAGSILISDNPDLHA